MLNKINFFVSRFICRLPYTYFKSAPRFSETAALPGSTGSNPGFPKVLLLFNAPSTYPTLSYQSWVVKDVATILSDVTPFSQT